MSTTLGFVGVGVMGGGLCKNLALKSGCLVRAADVSQPNLEAVASFGVSASNLSEIARQCEIVFLSLPSIAQVEDVCLGHQGLVSNADALKFIVDMSTSDVGRTRALAEKLQAAGITLVDAPVARSREAANNGTLLITVGASAGDFALLEPYLRCMGTDVLLCGGVGSGQVVKIMNNKVLLNTVHALAEAFAIAEKAGVAKDLLSRALSLGSANSFALKLTGDNYLARDDFPEKMFPTSYALKDLNLAITLAEHVDGPSTLSRATADTLEKAEAAGYGANYYPVIYRVVGRHPAPEMGSAAKA
ncbi:NAD(P)-dependent oxidoreductase [Bordetella sp. 2513F-2]